MFAVMQGAASMPLSVVSLHRAGFLHCSTACTRSQGPQHLILEVPAGIGRETVCRSCWSRCWWCRWACLRSGCCLSLLSPASGGERRFRPRAAHPGGTCWGGSRPRSRCSCASAWEFVVRAVRAYLLLVSAWARARLSVGSPAAGGGAGPRALHFRPPTTCVTCSLPTYGIWPKLFGHMHLGRGARSHWARRSIN